MANGNDVPNARLRAKSANEAYDLWICALLDLDTFLLHLNLSLYMSLVESRNSFSMHIAPPSFNAFELLLLCTTELFAG